MSSDGMRAAFAIVAFSFCWRISSLELDSLTIVGVVRAISACGKAYVYRYVPRYARTCV